MMADIPDDPFKNIYALENLSSVFIKKTKSGHFHILQESKIMGFIRSRMPSMNQYAGLKELLNHTFTNPSLIDAQKMRTLLEKIRKEYIAVSAQSPTAANMKRKNDLYEAYVLGMTKLNEMKLAGIQPLTRIRSQEVLEAIAKVQTASKKPLQHTRSFAEHMIALVEYSEIQAAADEFLKSGTPLNAENLAAALGRHHVTLENAPMGSMIDFLYSHRFKGRENLNRVVTAICNWKYNSPKKIDDVKKTLDFFKKLHITLETDIGGELYSFSEVFGYDVSEPKTYQESFARTLRPEALEKLLISYRTKQEDVRKALSDPNAQVICSNSFNRTTLHEVSKGSVGKNFSITGKVLQGSEENLKAARKETSYTGRFQFSVASLLGEGAPLAVPESNEKAKAEIRLLERLRSFVNENATLLVVQRLAPEDIHHFYQTADTTILTKKEWCDALGVNELETVLQQDTHPTINIEGVMHSSVNRKALFKEAEILAQNDRKIMLCRNNDGSLVIHVFIGATGVNKVDVEAQTGPSKGGSDLGSMNYGNEVKGPSWLRNKQNRLLRIGNSIKRAFAHHMQKKEAFQPPPSSAVTVQANTVGFGQGSSTVISLYLKKDYLPLPEVEKFFQTATFNVPGEKRNIEMKSRVGDVLATPVLFQTKELMGTLHLQGETPDERFSDFKTKVLNLQQPFTSVQTLWQTLFERIPNSNTLEAALQQANDPDDKYQLTRLKQFLEKNPTQ